MSIRHYNVCAIRLDEKTVEVTTDAPPEEVRARPPELDLFGERFFPEVADVEGVPAGTRYRVGPGWAESAEWPQINARFASSWAVLPAWALLAGADGAEPVQIRCDLPGAISAVPEAPCNRDELAPFAVLVGFARFDAVGGTPQILLSPGAERAGLGPLARAATEALAAGFGPLPVARSLLSIEPQSPDTGREKGFAHIAAETLYSRLLYRASADGTPRSPADVQDLVVHELLHHHLVTEDAAGSWLVEGLVTYLARRILKDAGLVSDRSWRAWCKRARADLAKNPTLDQISLADAPARFGEEHVPNLVYAKGFLVGAALDRQLGGRLQGIAHDLVRHGSRGAITPEGFALALPDAVRPLYQGWLRATGLPEPD